MPKKSLTKQGIALLLGVAIAGFGWLAVKGFSDFFDTLTPTWKVILGVAGVLGVGWIIKEMRIKVRSPIK